MAIVNINNINYVSLPAIKDLPVEKIRELNLICCIDSNLNLETINEIKDQLIQKGILIKDIRILGNITDNKIDNTIVEYLNINYLEYIYYIPTGVGEYVKYLYKDGIDKFIGLQKIKNKTIHFHSNEHLLENIVLLRWLFNTNIIFAVSDINDIKEIFNIEKDINQLGTYFSNYKEWFTISLPPKFYYVTDDRNIQLYMHKKKLFKTDELKEIFYKLFGVNNDTEDDTNTDKH